MSFDHLCHMAHFSQLIEYWNTARYLKPVQVYGRLWFGFHKPRPDLRPAPPLRERIEAWTEGPRKRQSMFGPALFRFLNEEHELLSPSDWNNPEWDKLWLYNLHYFDDLNAEAAEGRLDRQMEIMRRWILENAPGEGNGWEPYPISLRVVNWIKWAIQGVIPDKELLQSLAVQVRFLRTRLEYHLLGNHLFANAKALVFAGAFFSGREADEWLEKGMQILERQIPEQILDDGGHFERSPMYHCIILEDVLDLINLGNVYNGTVFKKWGPVLPKLLSTAERMLCWLETMSHPDGEIVLFNDAAFGIALSPAQLKSYANRLRLNAFSGTAKEVTHLPETGYIRVRKGPVDAFIDAGLCGPDYLLGHAHADTLSFEFSFKGQRVIVDSGTSCYGGGPERTRQRSTVAHNTVTIDGLDSSEVWGGFRMARRARPCGLEVCETGEEIMISCSHDGYRRLPNRPAHQRQWVFREKELSIRDTVAGEFASATGRFYFHPEVKLHMAGLDAGIVELPSGQKLDLQFRGGRGAVKPSTYHPEFGKCISNQCIEIEFTSPELFTTFHWA